MSVCLMGRLVDWLVTCGVYDLVFLLTPADHGGAAAVAGWIRCPRSGSEHNAYCFGFVCLSWWSTGQVAASQIVKAAACPVVSASTIRSNLATGAHQQTAIGKVARFAEPGHEIAANAKPGFMPVAPHLLEAYICKVDGRGKPQRMR